MQRKKLLMNDIMLIEAKEKAALEFSRLSGKSILPEDCYVVWFCKTLQNWKALVSTNLLNTDT